MIVGGGSPVRPVGFARMPGEQTGFWQAPIVSISRCPVDLDDRRGEGGKVGIWAQAAQAQAPKANLTLHQPHNWPWLESRFRCLGFVDLGI